ncbi:MAG TPA: hypothetical protein DDW49_11820 [Deltaproteobacteria bacterium]|nr:MAG: hypothetical protein A2048_02645 [Deltaproteobacteria bacterium GWA2_45_12]HBF14052.1 hypothetical protein [Deltaproteobacteria bacterium]
MTQIFSMPLDERRLRFASVEPKTGMASIIIEKDYWVVWALEQVFNVAELKDHLTFKGGTSLSKVYGLIKRFSEDIDLSIEKSFFGFSDENSPDVFVLSTFLFLSVLQFLGVAWLWPQGQSDEHSHE